MHDKVQTLDMRAQAREKLPVWYGSVDNFQHALKEVIANSTDEIINNFKNGEIHVYLHEDLKTITVTDSGRGIPIHGVTDGVKNFDLLFRTLFASTKYEETDQTLTGTNGVGITVANFTSKIFNIESSYGGYTYSVKFANGGELVQDLQKEKCDENKHGTSLEFELDDTIYPITTYKPDEVENIVKRYAVGSNKVRLYYHYAGEEKEYWFESLDDYYETLVNKDSTSPILSIPETEYIDEGGEKTSLKVILSTTPEPVQESYLNLTYLPEGGTFNEGMIAGIRAFANKYCKDNKLFKKGVKNFTASDIENSISFVSIAFSNRVEFQNQTKLATNKVLYRQVSNKHIKKCLEAFDAENPKGVKAMINHFLAIQQHNEKSNKAHLALKKKLTEKVEGIGNRVSKLYDSDIHGKDAELYIAEGNSALGSLVLARNAHFQAGYPIRGKMINCLKATYANILQNEEVSDLVKLIGCGIQADKTNKELESFNLDNLRFGKIICAADSDADGEQIVCLILTMIYRLMPDLIRKGHVYIAHTPLYEVKMANDDVLYIFNEQEKEEKLKNITGKYTIQRAKGLGEMDAEIMASTAMNPETRHLTQVAMDDEIMTKVAVGAWMGDSSIPRKERISEDLYKYVESVD